MALPPSLSKEARAQWHKLVEGFREPLPMTAISQVRHNSPHSSVSASLAPAQANHSSLGLKACSQFLAAWQLQQAFDKCCAKIYEELAAVDVCRPPQSAAHEHCVHRQGVGAERHLQILPILGRGGAAHKGKTRAVSEQAKELWTWCQVCPCLLCLWVTDLLMEYFLHPCLSISRLMSATPSVREAPST